MTAILVTLSPAADLLTASPDRELNPLAARLLAVPLLAVAAKLAEASLVLAAVSLIGRWRPGPLAGVVAVVAVVGGMVGTWSNL